MQEEMHEQMSGYKRMRREHQAALIKVGGPRPDGTGRDLPSRAAQHYTALLIETTQEAI